MASQYGGQQLSFYFSFGCIFTGYFEHWAAEKPFTRRSLKESSGGFSKAKQGTEFYWYTDCFLSPVRRLHGFLMATSIIIYHNNK